MAIVTKDGFEFYQNVKGEMQSFIITGKNIDSELAYIKKNRITSISLTYFKSRSILNLNFLTEISFIERISIQNMEIDYSGLYFAKRLRNISLSVKNKTQHLDYSRFEHLNSLSLDWYQDFPDLINNSKLVELIIWKFKPKSQSFSELRLPRNLKSIHITETNIKDFNGLTLSNLEKFEGHYCSKLISLDGISNISKKLNTLILDQCKKINNYDDLRYAKLLHTIILGDCGEILTLKWLKELSNVRHFSFWNTNLMDGDISPCIGIEFVSFKNAKHYNFKNEEINIMSNAPDLLLEKQASVD